jgi:hypothetical protein
LKHPKTHRRKQHEFTANYDPLVLKYRGVKRNDATTHRSKISEQPIKQTFVYFYGGYCAENVQFKGKNPPLQNSTCTVTDKILEIT